MKVYFKGFNELRAIGALTVIFGHIELIKSFNGVDNLMEFGFYKYTNGHIGVILFFVLSGFLITYFLLKEVKESNTLNIKLFYFKRLTRIWPIYYLMILFSIYIFPQFLRFNDGTVINYSINQTKYYLLFLPNIAKNLNMQINGASHLWSIGVEEQFYLIWPLVIYFFKRNIGLILISFFLIFSLLNPFIDYLSYNYHVFKYQPEMKHFLNSFLSSFKINAMALGGIFAYLLSSENYKQLKKLLYNPYFEILIVSITTLSWISGTSFGTFNDEIYCILFGMIIYMIGTNNNTNIKIENKLFNYLGKISYGLYVYHWLVIVILIELIKPIFFNNIIVYNLILYILTFLLTIIISEISYRYIERPLINLKYRLSQ